MPHTAEHNPILIQARKAQQVNSSVAAPETSAPVVDVPDNPSDTPLPAPVKGETITSGNTVSKRVTTNTQIDDPAAVSFGSTMDSIDEGLARGAVFNNQLQKIKGAEAELNIASAEVTKNAVVNKQVINTQKAQATMQAEKDAERVFDAMGGTDRLVELAAGRKAAFDKQIAKQEEIQANIDVDFSDDPIQWLVNKFTLGALGEEETSLAHTVGLYDNALGKINSLASASERTIDAMKSTATDATLSASSKLLAQQAILDSTKFELSAKKSNADAVAAGMAMSKDQVASQITKWRLGLQARTEIDSRAERDLRRKALEKDERFQTSYVDAVIEGRRDTGTPIYTGTDPAQILKERETIWAERLAGGDTKTRVDNQFDVGTRAVAPTPAQTLRAIDLSVPIRLTDGKNQALTTLNAASEEAIRRLQELPGKKTKEDLDAAINTLTKVVFDTAEKEIVEGDLTNPNRAAPIGALITLPGVRDEPLVTEVIAPLITEPGKDIDVSTVVKLAAGAIKTKFNPEGKITINQALSGLKAIYGKAVVYNNLSQDRENLGLPLQTKYNFRVRTEDPIGFKIGFFGKPQIVDIMGDVEVRKLILRELNAKSALGVRNLGIDGLLDFSNKIKDSEDKEIK